MKWKKLINMLLLVGACTIPCTSSFASSSPEVLWDLQAIDGIERRDASVINLVDQQTLVTVGKLLDDKVKLLERQGRLPFKTVVISDYKNNTWKSKLENKDVLALIPVITSDVNTYRRVEYRGVIYYAYDILAELNIMLCSFDGKNLKIVYNLPLSNKATLGDSFEDALTSPLTVAQLKEQYRYNLEQLIDIVDFDSSVKRILSAPGDYPTYQVTEVRVAPSIRANYGMNDLSDVRVDKIAKPVIASSFTNGYASKYKERIVLPSKTSGLHWRKEIVKHISSSNISAGEYSPEHEAPADVELAIKLKDFSRRSYLKNNYSIMKEIDFDSSLEASEISCAGEKIIASAYARKNYRLPKDMNSLVEYNYIDIFSNAGDVLSSMLIPERKNRR